MFNLYSNADADAFCPMLWNLVMCVTTSILYVCLCLQYIKSNGIVYENLIKKGNHFKFPFHISICGWIVLWIRFYYYSVVTPSMIFSVNGMSCFCLELAKAKHQTGYSLLFLFNSRNRLFLHKKCSNYISTWVKKDTEQKFIVEKWMNAICKQNENNFNGINNLYLYFTFSF